MTPKQNDYIKTLDTKEKIFNHVARHLRSQGKRSLINPNIDACGYRGDKNTMCAVGCVISDDEYDPLFESRDAHVVLASIPRLAPFSRMLWDLQVIHDDPSSWDPVKGFIAEHQLSWVHYSHVSKK